jgi:hypothetical protein
MTVGTEMETMSAQACIDHDLVRQIFNTTPPHEGTTKSALAALKLLVRIAKPQPWIQGAAVR